MMIWFTRRQFRSQTVIAAAALAAFGALLLVTVPIITDLYADVAACHSDSASVVTVFLARFKTRPVQDQCRLSDVPRRAGRCICTAGIAPASSGALR